MAMLLAPVAAHAQRASENAVASADDAFGTNVGMENTGIYSENDTRGFSPTKAGNVRVDGIYIDTIPVLAGRLRASTAIRVGFSSEEYPFHAPTGIVDHKFRPFPDELGTSIAFHQVAYGGYIAEWDFRVPLVAGHVGLTGGVARSDSRNADGSGNHGYGTTVRPIIRFAGVEIAPFGSKGGFRKQFNHPLVVVSGPELPDMPKKRRYLGQRWAEGRTHTANYGVTLKAAVTDGLSLRGGLFYVESPRTRNFTEIFSVDATTGLAQSRVIADPHQDIHSTSGEIQVAWRKESGPWEHRVIAGYRARNRLTESGGSDLRDFGQVRFGEVVVQPEPTFTFRRVNAGRVRQSALMLGYLGKVDGLSINLGVQTARYRGSFRDGRTGALTISRDDPLLYNSTITVDLASAISVYAGSESGLEDSGAAPENAANRNEQLPPTRTKQYEGGVRWKFDGGQLVLSAFQITKPYFAFETPIPGVPPLFTQRGKVRHRGVEASLSGHFGKRLSLVAGAVLMQPRVSGGGRPIGTPSLYSRIDANYRTDIFGGLTPTVSVAYTSRRPVRTGLSVPGCATVDLGLRQQFTVAGVPASIRAVVQNVFDTATWKVIATNTLYPDERRRLSLSLAADF